MDECCLSCSKHRRTRGGWEARSWIGESSVSDKEKSSGGDQMISDKSSESGHRDGRGRGGSSRGRIAGAAAAPRGGAHTGGVGRGRSAQGRRHQLRSLALNHRYRRLLGVADLVAAAARDRDLPPAARQGRQLPGRGRRGSAGHRAASASSWASTTATSSSCASRRSRRPPSSSSWPRCSRCAGVAEQPLQLGELGGDQLAGLWGSLFVAPDRRPRGRARHRPAHDRRRSAACCSATPRPASARASKIDGRATA